MNKQRGFTLVELTVTIVFLGAVVVGIASLYFSIGSVQRQTAYLESANRAAQTEVETLRNSNYNQLVNGQNIDFTSQLPSNLPAATGTVVVSEPQAGLKRVDVTVRYSATSTAPKQVTLSSLIGVIGITQ